MAVPVIQSETEDQQALSIVLRSIAGELSRAHQTGQILETFVANLSSQVNSRAAPPELQAMDLLVQQLENLSRFTRKVIEISDLDGVDIRVSLAAETVTLTDMALRLQGLQVPEVPEAADENDDDLELF